MKKYSYKISFNGFYQILFMVKVQFFNRKHMWGEAMANYIFKGKLRAYICKECLDVLADVKVRLYRHRDNQDVSALVMTEPKHTFSVLSDTDITSKEHTLITETTTDQNGEFVFLIDSEKDGYGGEAFEVDLLLTSVPGRQSEATPVSVQCTITSLQLEWVQSGNDMVAPYWDYIIPDRYWCHLLSRFDLWVICGRFVTCEGKQPLPGATIRAFDADWIQHDALGEDVTDFNGRFRIYYTSADFKKTPFTPWINVELIGGPDLFFQAELGGTLVINESSSAGRQPGRENAGHCFCIELCTDQVQTAGCRRASPLGTGRGVRGRHRFFHRGLRWQRFAGDARLH